MTTTDNDAALPASAHSPAPDEAYAPLPKGLLVGLALFLVLAAIGGYWWKHSSQGPDSQTAPSPSDARVAPIEPDKVEPMVQGLIARLKDNPGDAVGWAMLARTYSVVGKAAEAVDAYAHAVKLNATDAALLIDYADAIAASKQGSLEGEPIGLVQQALKMEPRNIKGQAIAGKYFFDRKEYATALKHWDQVLANAPSDNFFVQQIQRDFNSAKAALASPVKSASAAAAPAAEVRGSVTLAPALLAKTRPDDTVFIVARAVNGTRLPLAILRKQVKDLPLSFVFNDTMAMSPESRISGAGQVVLTARISRSASAMPQVGDLVGQVGPLAVGAPAVALEIGDTLQP